LQTEHFLGIPIEDFTGLRDPDLTTKPVNQALAGFLFEGADVFTDCGLGKQHGLGGPGETLEFNDLAIDGKFVEIHGFPVGMTSLGADFSRDDCVSGDYDFYHEKVFHGI
jgi:hypothetical protein